MNSSYSNSSENGKALDSGALPGSSFSRLVDLYTLRWKLSRDLLEEELRQDMSQVFSVGALGLGLAILVNSARLGLVGMTIYLLLSAGWTVAQVILFLLLTHGFLALVLCLAISRLMSRIDFGKRIETWKNRLF
jgi:hypothetical protein